MNFHPGIPLIIIALLLSSCGGSGTPAGNPDPGDGGQPADPVLADPSEVQFPQAILPPAEVIWAAQGGDSGNTSRTELSLPLTQPRIVSLTSISDLTSSAARIAADGSVLVGCGALLMKFSPDGELQWQRSLLRQLNANPLVDGNGQVVIPSGDPVWMDSAERKNWIEAIDPAGQTRWRHETGDYPGLVYAMAADGSVLVRSDFGELQLLDPGGSVKWTTDLGASAIYNAVFGEDGNLYTGTDRQALLCLGPDGGELWEYSVPGLDAAELTTNRRLLHPDGSLLLLSGSEGQPESYSVSVLSSAGSLLDSWPCGEQFSFTGVDDTGNIQLHDREARVSSFTPSGELLGSEAPGYGFPFGISGNSGQRFFSVLARPDDFSEYLLASTDGNGNELWRISSQWSFRYPVQGSGGLLYCGDEQGFFAVDSLGRKHWQQLHGDRLSGLSVSGNGRIYSSGGRNLYAFDQSGQQLWQVTADGSINGAPAILPGGQLAFGDSEGLFYFYENNGTRISKFILEGAVSSAPAVAADGTVYIGTSAGFLYSFSAGLEPLRQFEADSAIFQVPAVDSNGTVYVATQDGHVHAVYSDGIEAWEANLGEALAAPMLVGDDYRIFGMTTLGRVFALHSITGELIWDHYLGTDTRDSLALDSSGRLLVGTAFGSGSRGEPQLERNGSGRGLYCFNADGGMEWSINGSSGFGARPLTDGNGNTCFEAGGWLVCADPAGNELWRLQAGFEGGISGVVPLAGGRIAVASESQLLIIE